MIDTDTPRSELAQQLDIAIEADFNDDVDDFDPRYVKVAAVTGAIAQVLQTLDGSNWSDHPPENQEKVLAFCNELEAAFCVGRKAIKAADTDERIKEDVTRLGDALLADLEREFAPLATMFGIDGLDLPDSEVSEDG